jgi:hypothetical protein
VLDETSASTDVHDGGDRSLGVVLDRDRTRVAALAVDEVCERHDPSVADRSGVIDADQPREVALLRPELRRVRELMEQIGNDPPANPVPI